MPGTTEAPLLKLESEVWKARAQAKQQRLERALSEPAHDPHEVALRALWIKRALKAVKRGQNEITYLSALIDAHAQHLSVLEMSLLQAIEGKKGAPG